MLSLRTRKCRRRTAVTSPVKSPQRLTLSPLQLTPKKSSSKTKLGSPRGVAPITLSPSKKVVAPRRKLVLSAPDTKKHRAVAEALQASSLSQLVCRQHQCSDIEEFIRSSISGTKAGSLYISGAPGTGKTACLKKVLDDPKWIEVHKVFVNCMSQKSSAAICGYVASKLCGKKVSKEKEAIEMIEHKLKTSKKMVMIVLDEIDHLEEKNQTILYRIFEWPTLPNSKLILIGIANALDLTDRLLPRLSARLQVKPVLLHFPPYSKQDISTIIMHRLKGVPGSELVISSSAIHLLSGKVAAVTGDVRKALAVCRRAVEVTERKMRQQLLIELDENVDTSESAKVAASGTVGPATIMQVFSEVYEHAAVQQSQGASDSFPIHQKLAVCSLLLMMKNGKGKEVQMGKLHESYSRVCKGQHVVPVVQSEFSGVLEMLQARGIILIKSNREARLSKLSLMLDETELVQALQDKELLAEILRDIGCVRK